VTGPDFVRDINAYTEALAESADDSGEFLSERVELAFACRGGRDCVSARRWYEWFRDSFCSTNKGRDITGSLAVSSDGVSYSKLRHNCSDVNPHYIDGWCQCVIMWYYGNGKKIHDPDVEEFARLCGVDYSRLPDYREDMLDDEPYV